MNTVSTKSSSSKRAGRFLHLAPGLAVLALVVHLISNQFNVTSVSQPLGPVTVVAAIDPNTIEPGPAMLHLQLSLATDTRPVTNGEVTARIWDGTTSRALQVTSKAVPGAFEIPVEVASGDKTRITVKIAATNPLGEIEYELIPSQKGPRVARATVSP